ncbi:MAG: hypothetical protein BIFFINMI_00662 [Phycisphaerae bacterium]|nr:hypothetical protein [Phycisphaerae bacterium]
MLTVAVALAILACPFDAAWGKDFKSDDGYSLSYPDDWVILTKGQQQEVARVAREKGVRVPEADLSMISCMVVDLAKNDFEFAPNVNMVVVRDRLTPDNATCAKYRKMLSDKVRSFGGSVEEITVNKAQVGSRSSLFAEWSGHLPGVATRVHQKQYFVPAGGKVYIMTLTEAADHRPHNDAAFNRIVGSLQVKAGLDLTMMSLAGTGIAAAVGAVIFLAYRKRRGKPAPIPVPVYATDYAAAPPAVPTAEPWQAAAQPQSPDAPPQQDADMPAPAAVATAPAGTDEKIVVVCPGCGRQLRARSSLSGRTCRCPGCNHSVVVP